MRILIFSPMNLGKKLSIYVAIYGNSWPSLPAAVMS